MECPKCGFDQAVGVDECPRCGIVYSKIRKSLEPAAAPVIPDEEDEVKEPQGIFEVIRELLFDVRFETNPFVFGGRVLFFLS